MIIQRSINDAVTTYMLELLHKFRRFKFRYSVALSGDSEINLMITVFMIFDFF